MILTSSPRSVVQFTSVQRLRDFPFLIYDSFILCALDLKVCTRLQSLHLKYERHFEMLKTHVEVQRNGTPMRLTRKVVLSFDELKCTS